MVVELIKGSVHEEIKLITTVEVTTSFTWAQVNTFQESFIPNLVRVSAAVTGELRVDASSLTAAGTAKLRGIVVRKASMSRWWAANVVVFVVDVGSKGWVNVSFTAISKGGEAFRDG